jgi:hypothetical protein
MTIGMTWNGPKKLRLEQHEASQRVNPQIYSAQVQWRTFLGSDKLFLKFKN